MKTKRDLATFVGVTYETFTFLLRRKPATKRYKSFTISKKNGKPRLIEAPIKPIREMQRRVADVLLEIHQPRKPVFGFVKDMNIAKNAKVHCRKRWILNIDLQDFFHSVHFGRIRGILQSPRFNFNRDVAQELAHLCCLDGRLPQGAPTSPVMSNIVCDRLDAELTSFAREHDCRYTRYCDDITFSTTRREFPLEIATFIPKQEPKLSDAFVSLIEKHGFRLNPEKTRLLDQTKRQEVTGLTANVRPNVTREFVRQVRAMLHAWRKHGLPAAQNEFATKWDKKDRGPRKRPPKFEKVVRGKIDFIGLVRGERDPIYVKLLRYYCNLNPDAKSKVLTMIDATEKDVFLCHASEDKDRVVKPIADALELAGISYFLDAKEILWGDSVTNVINRALVQAKFVLVVISERSLEKHWPQKEMNAALAREISEGTTRVLPLLVAADDEARDALWRRLALHGDKRYLSWGDDASKIVAAVKELLTRLEGATT